MAFVGLDSINSIVSMFRRRMVIFLVYQLYAFFSMAWKAASSTNGIYRRASFVDERLVQERTSLPSSSSSSCSFCRTRSRHERKMQHQTSRALLRFITIIIIGDTCGSLSVSTSNDGRESSLSLRNLAVVLHLKEHIIIGLSSLRTG